MPHDWKSYSLSELRAHAIATFREGGGSRPDVFLIEIDGQKAVLKDQNGADKLFATLIGPLLNWRECKALTKLDAVPYTPKLLAKPDKRSFLMSYHQSEQVTRLKEITVDWSSFFPQLKTAINTIHNSGVAHNDLRNPSNILVTPEGQPVLVDMVGCFCRGQAWNMPNRWIFNKFTQVDLSAISKLKQRVAPELLGEDDIQAKDIAGRPGLWIKGLGQAIRKVSRRLFTR